MKILMTGMSTRTVGSTRVKINYITFAPIMMKALREMGHEVEQRKVVYGENFEGYDRAIVHVGPLDKIVCQNVPEVCHTLRHFGDRATIYVEDWVACEIHNSWPYTLSAKRWPKWLAWKGYDKLQTCQINLMEEELPKVREGVWKVMGFFHPWGNPSAFFESNFGPKARWRVLDPTMMLDDIHFRPTSADTRKRQWVFATLQDHDRWLKSHRFNWPVLNFGNKRKGEVILQEHEVAQLYSESWGVLAPKYPTIGWWRARIVLAAMTGAILYVDKAEAYKMGGSYPFEPWSMEDESVAKLAMLAMDQKEQLARWSWPKEQFLSSLSDALGL